jgi:hypothetical protein
LSAFQHFSFGLAVTFSRETIAATDGSVSSW